MTVRPPLAQPTVFALLVILLLTSACPSDDKPTELDPEDKEEFQCELGVLDENGDFIPASTQTPAELDLGFQGFLFVTTHVRATGEVPDTVKVTISTTIEGESPTGDTVPQLDMSAESEGKVLSDELLVFFNSSTPAELEHLGLDLSLRLESATHVCWVQGQLLMVDDDPCIHTGDEPICPTEDTDSGSD